MAAALVALALPVAGTPMLDAALMYAAAELAPVPLYGLRFEGSIIVGCGCGRDDCPPKNWGKHPVGNDWQKRASIDPDTVRERFAGHRGNIGVYVAYGRHLLIDADGDVGLETVHSWQPPDTLTQQSGSRVGAHLVYQFAEHQDPAAVTDRRVAPGVDVKARGQFVAAPSLHRSGGMYTITLAVAPTVLPDTIYEQIRKHPAARTISVPAPAPTSGPLVVRARAYLAKIPAAVSGNRGHDQCFTAARALAGWLEKGLPEADCLALLTEYNASCEPPWSERELAHKWADAQRAHTKPTLADRPAPHLRVVGPGDAPSEPPPPDPADYRAKLLWTETRQGKPKLVSHADNVIRILQLDSDWAGKIGFDAFRARIVVSADAPWDEYQRPSASLGAWSDNDTTRLSAWMRRKFHREQFAPSITDCERAVAVVARTHDFNPVRDYLESVAWDGKPRLATWLHDFLGAEQSPYTERVGPWWLISAVARVFDPGCKVDTVPILEGPQGLKKSTALEVLAGPEFFNDTPIDLNSKDAYSAIQGCWFVELAELESLMRVEASRAKAFFSSRKDRFRRAYARHEQDELRQCVFVGTVNLGEYLSDPTGARRFWPIRCTVVRLDELVALRDQLWAEAVARYEDAATRCWYPRSAEDAALLDEPQATRTKRDAWEALIDTYLRGAPDRVTTGNVLADALNLEPKDWTASAQTRVGILMVSRFGWCKRRPSDASGNRVWVYERPPSEAGQ